MSIFHKEVICRRRCGVGGMVEGDIGKGFMSLIYEQGFRGREVPLGALVTFYDIPL